MDNFPQVGERVELLIDWEFNAQYLKPGHKGTVVARTGNNLEVLMDEDPLQEPWAMSVLEVRVVED